MWSLLSINVEIRQTLKNSFYLTSVQNEPNNSNKSIYRCTLKTVMHQWNMKIMKLFILLIVVNDRSGPETQKTRFSEVYYSPTTQTSQLKLSTHFLGALVTPLPPASSSSDVGWRFSFSGFRLGPPKKSPIPFCHVGVGRGHTGFPPAYLLLADQSKHNKHSYWHGHTHTHHFYWRILTVNIDPILTVTLMLKTNSNNTDWLHQCENLHKCHKYPK